MNLADRPDHGQRLVLLENLADRIRHRFCGSQDRYRSQDKLVIDAAYSREPISLIAYLATSVRRIHRILTPGCCPPASPPSYNLAGCATTRLRASRNSRSPRAVPPSRAGRCETVELHRPNDNAFVQETDKVLFAISASIDEQEVAHRRRVVHARSVNSPVRNFISRRFDFDRPATCSRSSSAATPATCATVDALKGERMRCKHSISSGCPSRIPAGFPRAREPSENVRSTSRFFPPHAIHRAGIIRPMHIFIIGLVRNHQTRVGMAARKGRGHRRRRRCRLDCWDSRGRPTWCGRDGMSNRREIKGQIAHRRLNEARAHIFDGQAVHVKRRLRRDCFIGAAGKKCLCHELDQVR